MRTSRLIAIAALACADLVGLSSAARAVEVGCDPDASSADIQAVIDANPAGTTIELSEDCTYSITTTIMFKDDDTLRGATSSTDPETFLVGADQTIDCIGRTEPTGTEDATGVRLQTLDVSGCRVGIQLNDRWEVGGPGTQSVWSHDNDIGLNLGAVADPAQDITVRNVKLFSNDLMGLKGAMSDTGVEPRATVAFSEIFANGDAGAGCTQTSNCAGSKFFGGYARSGGVSPLVCGNVVRGNMGPLGQGHGLWVDVTGEGIGAFDRGLLFAGNTVEDNAGQGFRIERSDSHRIGMRGKVDCVGTTVDATNVINRNGSEGGTCVAVVVSEYTRVTNNECNVQGQAGAATGRLIQVSWKPRADLDEDGDGDISCTSTDPDDCQETTHNIVKNNSVQLPPSTDPIEASLGFFVTETPFPGTWSSNSYASNDYCVASNRSTEAAAGHFSWVDPIGARLDTQPWALSGSGNDWRDAPGPRYDDEANASFRRTCQSKT